MKLLATNLKEIKNKIDKNHKADRIHIVLGDITKFSKDAIVNDANSDLIMTDGLYKDIFKASGISQLEEACGKIKNCPIGQSVITPGFNLNAKFIIHAVGPVEKDRTTTSKLIKTYISIFELAKNENIKNIAIPLISRSLLKFPVNDTVAIATAVAIHYSSSFENIYLYVSPSYMHPLKLYCKELLQYREYNDMIIVEKNPKLKQEDLLDYLYDRQAISSKVYIKELYIKYLTKQLTFEELSQKYNQKEIRFFSYYDNLTERKKHDYNFMIERDNVNVYISSYRECNYQPTEYQRIYSKFHSDIDDLVLLSNYDYYYDIQNINFKNNNYIDLFRFDFDDYKKLTYTYYNGSKYIGSIENPYLILVKAIPDEDGNFIMHHDTINAADDAFMYKDDKGNKYPSIFGKVVLGYNFNSEVRSIANGNIKGIFIEDRCYGYFFSSMAWLSKCEYIVSPFIKLSELHSKAKSIKRLFIIGYLRYSHEVEYTEKVRLSYESYLKRNKDDLLYLSINNPELLDYYLANKLLKENDLQYLLTMCKDNEDIKQKILDYKKI